MDKKIVHMFSGQGSQYYQMGKELYDNHPRFKYWMDHCAEVAFPYTNTSLIDVLYQQHKKHEIFDQILYTNPALLSIEYSLSRVLIEMDVRPDFVLGYSLGEITASVVSGVMSLEDGMRLVYGMATLVKEKTPLADMLAVVEPQGLISELSPLFDQSWLTGENFQGNFVVSGLPETIQQIKSVLDQNQKISQILPVRYGFHTELLDPIEEDFKNIVRGISLSSMEIPIVSSLKRETITEINEEYYWQVIRQPVNFEKTIRWVQSRGEHVFIDAGPSGTLATFVKYILPANTRSLSLQMINQFGRNMDSLEKMKTILADIVR